MISCDRSWGYLLLSYVLAFLMSSALFFVTLRPSPSLQSQITPMFAHCFKTSSTDVDIGMMESSTGVRGLNDKYSILKLL
jgi:hypothetical protein